MKPQKHTKPNVVRLPAGPNNPEAIVLHPSPAFGGSSSRISISIVTSAPPPPGESICGDTRCTGEPDAVDEKSEFAHALGETNAKPGG